MARTIIQFVYKESNLFDECDEWAKTHKFTITESGDSSRLYRKRSNLITPITLFFPPYNNVKVNLESSTVSVEAWISFFSSETEISTASAYQFLPKELLRKKVNDLLNLLDQGDKLIR